MEAPEQLARGGDRNSSYACTTDNKTENRRGIRNISRVSCHVACAIQILCHAIPTVRSTLNKLALYQEASKDGQLIGGYKSSPCILMEELLDFARSTKPCVKDDSNETNSGESCDEENGNQPWNPQRLYDYLDKTSVSGFAINPNNVGDASRTLSCLLRLLSQNDACCGPAWKDILNASVWEGETRQILEGRRLLQREHGHSLPVGRSHQGIGSTVQVFERRFLQRIKPAANNKPMVSPLVLKFCRKQQSTSSSKNKASNESICSNTWSIVDALNEIVKPLQIKGSSYPWESISPDTYSEQEIFCRTYRKCNNSDGDSSSSSSRSRDDESEKGSSSSSSADDSGIGDDCDSGDESESTSDPEENNWITFKRLEIKKIPRIWMLHLDRPRISIDRLRQSIQSEDREDTRLLFDYVQAELDLDGSSLVAPITASTNDSLISDRCNDDDIGNSGEPMRLSLRGAIVQVVEIDDGEENEEDWEGGHSITLLRNHGTNEPLSWLLIDDDKTHTIPERRAIEMMGGVLERDYCAPKEITESDETHGWNYYAASLLVYSISGDGLNVEGIEEWKSLEKSVVSSWKKQKMQLAATVSLQNSYVGKRIKVKWAGGKFYAGTITEYDISTGKHQVTYDDGDVKQYDLAQKTVQWID